MNNISKQNLLRINDIYKSVLASQESNFYRNFYNDLKLNEITKEKDFLQLPFLTKNDILKVNLLERIYVPTKKITKYTFSSGTSNNLTPLVMPHSLLHNRVEGRDKLLTKLEKLNCKSLLFLLSPFHGSINPKGTRYDQMISIVGDIHDLRKTAIIVNQIELNVIFTTPTALDLFIDELTKVNFNFNDIKFISLGGEHCSELKKKYFLKVFPKAIIEIKYGSTESGGIRGYQCEYFYKMPTNYFHIPENILLETDDEGELIHTDLEKDKAFPLIRYKTGDIGEIRSIDCPCGNHTLLILGGRKDYDTLKFSGVILRSFLIDEALKDMDINTFEYRVHVYEKEIEDKIKPLLVFEFNTNLSTEDLSVIKENLLDKLYLAPQKNLRYFIENKIFLPLEIVSKVIEKDQLRKSRNIISHL